MSREVGLDTQNMNNLIKLEPTFQILLYSSESVYSSHTGLLLPPSFCVPYYNVF